MFAFAEFVSLTSHRAKSLHFTGTQRWDFIFQAKPSNNIHLACWENVSVQYRRAQWVFTLKTLLCLLLHRQLANMIMGLRNKSWLSSSALSRVGVWIFILQLDDCAFAPFSFAGVRKAHFETSRNVIRFSLGNPSRSEHKAFDYFCHITVFSTIHQSTSEEKNNRNKCGRKYSWNTGRCYDALSHHDS